MKMAPFAFHAELVVADARQRSLSFADRDEGTCHYLVVQRDEERRGEVLSDLENIYVERDDQRWGGYGGIERVQLDRGGMTLFLGERMAACMGGHSEMRVTFDVDTSRLREVKDVLSLIFRGYESRVRIG